MAKIEENALGRLNAHLSKQNRWLKISLFLPAITIAVVILLLEQMQSVLYVQEKGSELAQTWHDDYFTLFILGIFIFAQIAAFVKYLSFSKKRKGLNSIIRIIGWAGDLETREEVEKLRLQITDKVTPSEERSLVLNWLEYGGLDDQTINTSLTESSLSRVELTREKSSLFHIIINRIILKLGFIGTLVGLLMTFPNMKNAMLRLNESQGEMLFIEDITKAIDGDHFAILTTLLATALSLLAEFITIQLLSRYEADFDIALTYLSDWYTVEVQPLYNEETILEHQQEEMHKLQKAMEKNRQQLAEMIDATAQQMDAIVSFQQKLSSRVEELNQYEKDYRQIIADKDAAATPKNLRPKGEA